MHATAEALGEAPPDPVSEEPYFHLKARNVFTREAGKFDQRLRALEEIDDSYERSEKMIDHGKSFVTALDRRKGLAEIMGFELFIEDYVEETTWLADKMR